MLTDFLLFQTKTEIKSSACMSVMSKYLDLIATVGFLEI